MLTLLSGLLAAFTGAAAADSLAELTEDSIFLQIHQGTLSRNVTLTSTDRDLNKIPLTVLFNHKRNLLAISEEDPHVDEETKLLRRNVLHTITSFRGVGSPKVIFWDNQQCASGLRSLQGFRGHDLAEYFDSERRGMIKSDLCRLAMMYIHGGYYFDTDILPVVPMHEHIGKDTTFASVVAWGGKTVFQAFMAATPQHPLIAESIRSFDDWYRKLHEPGAGTSGTMSGGNVGTVIMQQAFQTWSGHHMANRVEHGNGHVSRFFFEHKIEEMMLSNYPGLLPATSTGICNFAVVDNSTQMLLMYSRVYDSRTPTVCQREQELLETLEQ